MYISYDYYRVFYYVAKYKSISQAAKQLLQNQPNLSKTIQNLESALDCTLFIRNRHGVTLTPEGEKLYAHIKIAFEHIEAGEEEISLEKSLQKGIVSVGVTEVALHCVLLPILKEYRARHPGVKIHITNHSTPQATEALKNGLLDFALVTTPTVKSSSITEKAIRPVNEVAICSKAYPELLGEKIPFVRLQDYPIILLGASTKTYERYSNIFKSHGIPFDPTIEPATTDQILPMVKADLGIGFIPEDMIKKEDDVYKIDLLEKIPERLICLIKRKEDSPSVAAKELERLIVANQ